MQPVLRVEIPSAAKILTLMKISVRALREIIQEVILRENPFQVNSLEADLNQIPTNLEHAIKMLVANFRVEMIRPQSKYGMKAEDDIIARAHRQKTVKRRADKLQHALNRVVSDAVREFN